ncbi:hypothetical protein PHYPSEUDO_014136 [Phytophthora pseudosyringae]|uniref:Uncharacterized protein n=1 Tax=Phytophthora pseudosyringae TaxID=221518 RepID=A0A8T1V4I3_9STRA|nr:hypothetical protein PHYPSEUDO_014136 [Phytophthora pseudosyringae]
MAPRQHEPPRLARSGRNWFRMHARMRHKAVVVWWRRGGIQSRHQIQVASTTYDKCDPRPMGADAIDISPAAAALGKRSRGAGCRLPTPVFATAHATRDPRPALLARVAATALLKQRLGASQRARALQPAEAQRG